MPPCAFCSEIRPYARAVVRSGTLVAAVLLVLASACSSSEPEATAPEETAATSTTAPSPLTAPSTLPPTTTEPPPTVTTGARALLNEGFSSLRGLRVGLIANPTSVVGDDHLIDLLDQADDVVLAAIFAPEHGLRGSAGAGELLGDSVDRRTGVTVFSLYGDTFRPTQEMLDGVDVLVYDLQDVGSRFYTYIATMGLAMEAASEADIPFVVLDRPAVIGEVGGGFVLEDEQRSFVGPYEIPAAYGMTAAELARFLVAEGEIEGGAQLDLRVVPLRGWERSMRWEETGIDWTPPSPGLPTPEAAVVYPGTVLLEATTISFGGGTEHPFAQAGAPWADGVALAAELEARGLPGVRFEAVDYEPRPISGRTVEPRLVGEALSGVRIVVLDEATFSPVATGVHLLDAFLRQGEALDEQVIDRPEFFDLLAGTTRLRTELEAGIPAAEIVASWTDELAEFSARRAPHLLYG